LPVYCLLLLLICYPIPMGIFFLSAAVAAGADRECRDEKHSKFI